ncbi:BT0820 family HAD-type phosphatase [Sphingobacterium sp. Mn56C]|uniref:BT0820 family HAD-type phosphatase n=1 Tax=Sphingobacterium sp. Mn56C TaxID=3395261 RepID=UPI003BD176EF
MIIAVDFDGTIVEHKYPAIGKPIPFAIETLKQLQNERHILILWTVREGRLLEEAIAYCAAQGLHFFAHNANFPEENRTNAARKLTADLFIDDRNFGGLPDWGVIYQAIKNNVPFSLSFKENFAELATAQEKKKKKRGWFS